MIIDLLKMMKRELPARIKHKIFSAANLYAYKAKCFPPGKMEVHNIKLRFPEKLSEETKEYLAFTLARDKVDIFGYESDMNLLDTLNNRWQDKYWWKIDMSKLREDPKFFWEANRHQFLPVWALACHFEDYALQAERKLREYVSKWLSANPPEKGLNWQSSLEVAARAVSWALTYWIRQPEQDDFWGGFLKALYHHGAHIERHLFYSRSCVRNNHLLGELSALVILGIFFKKAEWINYWPELESTVSEQFYEDGVNFEQSINYHKYSLQFVILANIFLKKAGILLGEQVQQLILKAEEFVRWTEKPNGSWPNIGDNDNGMVCRLTIKEDDNSDCGAIRVLESNQEQDRPGSRAFDPGRSGKGFPQGGYFVKRTGWGVEDNYLLVKCGPHLYHAHADLLHFEYSFKGEDVFVDSGTYQYNNARPLRRYFRGTFAHNTVAIPRHDQSRQYKTFRWLQAARVLAINHDDSLTRFEATIEYGTCKVRHKRIIETDDDLDDVLISDEIRGSKKAYLLLHVGPGNEIELHGSTARLITGQGNEIQVEFITEDCLKVSTAKLPYSINYGVLEKHVAIVAAVRGGANGLAVQTRIRARANKERRVEI